MGRLSNVVTEKCSSDSHNMDQQHLQRLHTKHTASKSINFPTDCLKGSYNHELFMKLYPIAEIANKQIIK